ncbi:MAG: hypothetical protein K2O24_00535 [Muribaculaceae bacterium]|nr:hypothetical protein [Muribaculaceae bacterium]
MKRKLLNGVMLLTALTAVGTLSSCKDYDSEQLQQQQYNGSFTQKLNDLQKQLDALEEAHKLYEIATDARLDLLEKDIKDKLTQADLDDYVTDQDLKDAIEALRKELDKGPGCSCPDPIDEGAIEGIVKRLFKDEFTPEIQKWIADAIGTAITDIKNLQAQINGLNASANKLREDVDRINGLIDKCATKDEMNALIAQVQTVFDAKILALQTDINAVRYTVKTLAAQLDETNNRLDQLNESINEAYNAIGELKSSLADTDKKAVEALATAENNKRAITQLTSGMEIMNIFIQNLQGDVTDLQNKYNSLSNQYDDLNDRLNGLLGNIYDKTEIDNMMDALQTSLTDMLNTKLTDLENNFQLKLDEKVDNTDFELLVNRVGKLESDLAALQGDVNKLLGIQDRINSLITSVVVQGVSNPIFGTFNTPIGIQNNILFAYYGRFDGSYVEFPTADRTRAYNNEDPFTPQELAALQASFDFNKAEKYENGDILATGNLGRIYMTLNPNNVDVSGAQLSLERSNGVASEARLSNVVKSDAELHFGASRANNGFYQADVQFDLTDKAVASMKYEITPGLKSAVLDAVKNHTKGDVFWMLRKLFDQLKTNIPAYGLKAGWSVNGEDFATFSKYEIATVAFSPLSYSTFYGQSIGKHLPTHSPIDDALLEINKEKFKFHLNLKIDIKPVDADFEFDDVHFNYESNDFEIDLSGLTLKLDDGSTITFGQNETIKLNPKGIDEFLRNLEKEIDRATLKFTDDMDREFRRVMNNLVDQVNDNVNKAMKDLDKQINDKIEDLLDDIQGKINDKAGKVIDFINKFLNKWNDAADRINGWLDDPNHLLQPTLIYAANDGQFNRMSTHFNYPSRFVQAGGDGVELFASSNTLEVFAPAFKKFVAVVGEWDENDNLTPNYVATCKSINGGRYMAEILPGEQIRIALPTSRMKKGYKYEIIYTAMDFRGWISTQRFYVRIK